MKLIILTGGIASGKSTVSNVLGKLGFKIIDMDKIAANLVKKNGRILKEIVNCFGSKILDLDGQLDKLKLGNIIFNNLNSRKKLNQLMHPHILNKTNKIIKYSYSINPKQIILVDMPLFFEILKPDVKQKIVLVYAPLKIQIKRLMSRDGFSKEEAILRINSQLSIEKKRNLASIIINNSGSIENTMEEINIKLESIKKESIKSKSNYNFLFDS